MALRQAVAVVGLCSSDVALKTLIMVLEPVNKRTVLSWLVEGHRSIDDAEMERLLLRRLSVIGGCGWRDLEAATPAHALILLPTPPTVAVQNWRSPRLTPGRQTIPAAAHQGSTP
jgi:hypothetical protein